MINTISIWLLQGEVSVTSVKVKEKKDSRSNKVSRALNAHRIPNLESMVKKKNVVSSAAKDNENTKAELA